jgi:hypothetical protein
MHHTMPQELRMPRTPFLDPTGAAITSTCLPGSKHEPRPASVSPQQPAAQSQRGHLVTHQGRPSLLVDPDMHTRA